jgi:hypothetical protein
MRAPILLFIPAVFSLLLAKEVKLNVADETGAPVAGADASIYFLHPRNDDQGNGLTDEKGLFSARGSGSLGVGVVVGKAGYYSARIEGLSSKLDHDIKVILPRILNPIPLYAWRSSGWGPSPVLPIQGEWCGFDFEAADWVTPLGKGKVADILFRFRNEFKGWADYFRSNQEVEDEIIISKQVYEARKEVWTLDKFKLTAGKWDAVLEISFPGMGEGVFEEKTFLSYGQLKMPHLAPTSGYVMGWRYASNNYSPRTYRSNTGFFLRTRVKMDKDGKIVSANYAKVVGDFRLDAARGSVEFAYYFNPVPNDRNLEFDPKKNLFPEDMAGANVYDP